jgi:hypothetical protein
MVKFQIPSGTAHQLPADLKQALISNSKALKAWENITPLARNEWICWNVTVKQAETRKNHIQRTVKELQEGKRRPCCWMGCIHRKDKAINASQKWVLSRQSKITKR